MTEKELYEIEAKVNEKVDRIRTEQLVYLSGVEEGVALMFKAIHDSVTKQG